MKTTAQRLADAIDKKLELEDASDERALTAAEKLELEAADECIGIILRAAEACGKSKE